MIEQMEPFAKIIYDFIADVWVGSNASEFQMSSGLL